MDSKTNKILAKLSKEKGLKKVQLSKVDDIEEQVGLAMYLATEAFEEEYDKYTEAYGKARDILKFDADDAASYAESLLDDLLQEIKDLGVEIPPRVKQLQKEVAEAQQEIKSAQMKLERF